MKLSDHFKTIGKPFSYYPNLAKALGSAKAAILLCSLIWRDSEYQEGSIQKTEKEIQDETGLSRKEVRSAKKLLSEKKILKSTHNRLEHSTVVEINLEPLDAILTALPEVPKGPPGSTERATPECQKGNRSLPLRIKNENKNDKHVDPLPEWVPVETWESFVQMRKFIKRPMTDYAQRLIVAKLDKLRGGGNNPRLVLEQSIEFSWQGVFPLKQDDVGLFRVQSTIQDQPFRELTGIPR